MKVLSPFLFVVMLGILCSCSKPQPIEEYPTKYPETPTMGAWEDYKV
jgi:hypothetical protein